MNIFIYIYIYIKDILKLTALTYALFINVALCLYKNYNFSHLSFKDLYYNVEHVGLCLSKASKIN